MSGGLLVPRSLGNGYVKKTGDVLSVDAGSGGGTTLPANAAGWLHNDGAGLLAWTTPPGGGLPADSAGWLHDNGAGLLVWSTPSKSDVGLSNVLNVAQEPALGNPGGDGYALVSTALGVRSWAAMSGAHNLLSGSHTDTLADTVVRGDLLVGNSTPKWARLAKGTSGYFLKSTATDAVWAAHGLTYSDVGADAAGAAAAVTPTTLGLVIGANTQAYSAKLTSIAALANAAGWLHNDGAGAFAYSTPSKTDVGLSAVLNTAQEPALGNPGADGYVLSSTVLGVRSWVAGSGGTPHTILSATHTDTYADTVQRGDILVGNSTPKWSRLAIGAAGKYLRTNGSDATWQSLSASDITSGNLPWGQMPNAGGTWAVGSSDALVSVSGGQRVEFRVVSTGPNAPFFTLNNAYSTRQWMGLDLLRNGSDMWLIGMNSTDDTLIFWQGGANLRASLTTAGAFGAARITSALHGTTTNADVVFDRNSVTQLTLGSLLATFAGAVTATGLITANNGLTVASGKTLTLTGVTVTGLAVGSGLAVTGGALTVESVCVKDVVGAVTGSAKSATRILKFIDLMADATTKTFATVTVPNGNHAAVITLTLIGSLGAGGTVGAFESTATNVVTLVLTRVVNLGTVAQWSYQGGAGSAHVAGSVDCTVSAGFTAASGATNATQTFDLQALVARASGSAYNHTCLVVVEVYNVNGSGVAIA